MVCAKVRNSPSFTEKCNKMTGFPFGLLAETVVKKLPLTPKNTVLFQLLITKIDP